MNSISPQAKRIARWLNIAVLATVILLIGLGWYLVFDQWRSTEETSIKAYQESQRELVNSIARTVHNYVDEAVRLHSRTDNAALEQEIFTKFIVPVQLLQNGDAWIYAPEHIVFDPSSDFPTEYRDKNMAEIFALQKEYGASHYEEMTDAVMNLRPGVGWYIWLPAKGKEVAAWAPVEVERYRWSIGVSTPLNEILAATGATSQFNTALAMMIIASAVTGTLLAVWGRSLWWRNRAEAALQASEEAIRQAQKLESLGLLAGGVAHDFNNLLVAMMGQTTLALRKLPPEHPARTHIEKAVNATEKAASLTQQLLAYSGKFQIKPELIDLNQFVTDNLRLFEITVPKHVQLASNLRSDLAPILADTAQIQQILMNLILNGVEAIGSQHGTVAVATDEQLVSRDEATIVDATGVKVAPGHYVTVEVRDTGMGMDEKTARSIFDPFFSTKATGRGLGLATVLGMVRSHKGHLTVKSQVGQGTIFCIYFPAQQSALPSLSTVAQTAETSYPLVGTVLVIDDEVAVRDFVTDLLSLPDLTVLTADDGKRGIELFRKHQGQVNLVLLDLSMPLMSGEETLVHLRAIDRETPVLISSGYSERANQVEQVRKGANGSIPKPYSADTFLQAIRPYLAGKS